MRIAPAEGDNLLCRLDENSVRQKRRCSWHLFWHARISLENAGSNLAGSATERMISRSQRKNQKYCACSRGYVPGKGPQNFDCRPSAKKCPVLSIENRARCSWGVRFGLLRSTRSPTAMTWRRRPSRNGSEFRARPSTPRYFPLPERLTVRAPLDPLFTMLKLPTR